MNKERIPALAEKVREMLQPVEQIEKFLLELGVTYI